MDVFTLRAVLGLDSTEYDKKLSDKKKDALSIGGAIGGALGTAAKVGAAAVTAASGAAVAFGASSVKAGSDFDAAMSQVGATMLKTTDEMQKEVGEVDTAYGHFSGNLREFAQFLGSETAFSATQSAEALNYMALAGYNTQESMNMLPNVLSLAAAGGMDLAKASDMVTDAQSALGLSFDQTGQMVDQMAMTASKSNTSVSQLGDAILTVGGTAKDLKGGTVELSAALGVLANAGIKGSEGGTTLRNVLLAMIPKSEDAAEAMEKIGFNAYDADGELRPLNEVFKDMAISMSNMSTQERQNVLKNIFNKVDLKGVNAMLAQASDGLDKVGYALEASGVEWGKYAEKPWMKGKKSMDAFYAQVEYLMKDLQLPISEAADFLVSEYGMASEDAVMALTAVNDTIGSSSSTWEELTADIENAKGSAADMANIQLDNLEGDITLFKSALEGVQIAISDVVTPALRNFVQMGTDGLSELANALRAGDIDLAIQAFADLVANATQAVVEHLPEVIDIGVQLVGAVVEGIIKAMPKLITSAVNLFKSFKDNIINKMNELVPGSGNIMTKVFQTFEQWFIQIEAIVHTITDIIIEIWDKFGANIMKAAEVVWKRISLVIETAIKLIQSVLNIVLGLISGDWSKVWEGIKGVTSTIWNAITGIITTFLDNISNLIDVVLKFLGNLIGSALNGIRNAINTALNVIKNVVTTVSNAIRSVISTVWSGIKTTTENVWNTIKQKISDVINNVKSVISGVLSSVKSTWTETWDNLKQKASDIWEAIKNTVDDLKEGISSNINNVRDTVKRGIDDAVDYIKDLPSKARRWGRDLIDNFVDGIRSMIHRVEDTISNVADIVADFISFSEPDKGPLSNFHTYAPDMIDLFTQGIKENAYKIPDAFNTALDMADFKPIEADINTEDMSTQRGSVSVVQNIYSKAKTASELMREARYEQERAVLMGV